MVYNLRNDFDEKFGLQYENKKYRKKRLLKLINLYGESRIDIENGTTMLWYMEYILNKRTGDNVFLGKSGIRKRLKCIYDD